MSLKLEENLRPSSHYFLNSNFYLNYWHRKHRRLTFPWSSVKSTRRSLHVWYRICLKLSYSYEKENKKLVSELFIISWLQIWWSSDKKKYILSLFKVKAARRIKRRCFQQRIHNFLCEFLSISPYAPYFL